jgi:hypothetical protein
MYRVLYFLVAEYTGSLCAATSMVAYQKIEL